MEGFLDKNGVLNVVRENGPKKQSCPYSDNLCSDECPQMEIQEFHNYSTGCKDKRIVLICCNHIIQTVSTKQQQNENLEKIIKIQERDGNWNANEYQYGIMNGMILAQSIINNTKPIFKERPIFKEEK